MIHATGDLDALQLSIDGTPITTLNHAELGFALDGQAFTVKCSGFLSPIYALSNADGPVVSIQRAPFVNRYQVPVGDQIWTLQAEGLLAQAFGLYDGETRVGGIVPAGRFRATKSIDIDFPDTIPLAVQVFLMWVVLWKWGDNG